MRSLVAVEDAIVSQSGLKLAYRVKLIKPDFFVLDAATAPERDDPRLYDSFRPIAELHYLLSIT